MRPYADTNFFTRLYLRLPETPQARSLLNAARQAASTPFPVTWLLRLELVNALQLHVFAGRSPGQARVTLEQAAAAHALFREDLAHPSSCVQPI